MFHAPFFHRAAVLLVALAVASGLDWWFRRERATRPRETLFLLASGATGAAFGALHDALTSAVSPEYFEVLKGLGPLNLRARSILLGAQAGAAAGIVLGCVACYVLGRRARGGRPPAWRELVRLWPWSAGGAVFAASFTGALAWRLIDPSWTHDQLGGLTPDQGRRLLTVWAVHWSTYIGGAAGAASYLWRARGR